MTQSADVAAPVDEQPENRPQGRLWTTSTAFVDFLRANLLAVFGGLGSVVAAVLLFTRFSLNGSLSRDESIYVYGAIRFSHGVPPYESIFDPKTPMATMLGGFAAGIARVIGHNELYLIRVEFLLLSLLTVAAVYLLALTLFDSVSGAVVSAIAFACYTKFADDAMAGPDAKTPGVLFMVICMLLLVRRRWFAAGVFAGLTFLVWQPLLWFPVICVVAAAVGASAGRRWRTVLQAAGGVAFPIVIVSLYFIVAGAFGDFVTSAFIYPLSGTVRPPETFGQHIRRIVDTIGQFPLTALIFWLGSACLVAVIVIRLVRNRDDKRAVLTSPLVLVVAATFALNLLYALYDFQSAPDTLPFLPYPVLGLAGMVAELRASVRTNRVASGAVTAVSLVIVLLMGTFGFLRFGHSHSQERGLVSELREACGLHRIAGKRPVIALGNPTQLVLLNQVSSSKYIYLDAGVDKWKVDHTAGGLDAWGRQILAQHPNVVSIVGWDHSTYADQMRHFLKQSGFVRRYVGKWQVWITETARDRARAQQENVRLTILPKLTARNWQHRKLPGSVPCPVTSRVSQ